ncbi:hypothetical protein [Microcoleus sp. Pol12B5]|uniref:hypothetical protein n=1 Tax=Microcoleus sp. Pol12B5 TaxID=3055396 RepID=UPI002FCEFBEC
MIKYFGTGQPVSIWCQDESRFGLITMQGRMITSIKGGKVRLRGNLGEGSHWQDYKAVRLHESYYGAFYQDNEALINYINHQYLANLLTYLGDGNEGIWKIISKLNPGESRRETLDGYHLIENLYKVGGSLKRLAKAKEFLWQGQIDRTLDLFKSNPKKPPKTFVTI